MVIGLYKTGGKGDGNLGREKLFIFIRNFKKWLFLVIKKKSKILEAKVLGGLARKKRSRRQAKEVEMWTYV
jgi:hypothetical protein